MEPEPLTPPSPLPPTGLRRRPRRRHYRLVAAALAGLALGAAACSGDPPTPGVAGSGSTGSTGASNANQDSSSSNASRSAAMLAYSQCMRAHGVADFPDPNSQGDIEIQGGPNPTSGLDPNSPTFQAAQKACQSKMPAPTPAEQAQAQQQALRVSQCMRAHGIKDFPDPQSKSGHVTMTINGSPGGDLNPNNPLFQKAQQACMPNAPKASSGNKTANGSSGGGFFIG